MADNTPYRGAGIYGADGETVTIPGYKPVTQALYTYGGQVNQIGLSIGTYYTDTGRSKTIPKRGERRATTTLYHAGSYGTWYTRSSDSYYLAAEQAPKDTLLGNEFARTDLYVAPTGGTGGTWMSVVKQAVPLYYSGYSYKSGSLYIRSTDKFHYTTGSSSHCRIGDEERCIITDHQLYEDDGYEEVPIYSRNTEPAFSAGASVIVASPTSREFYERDTTADTSVVTRGSRVGLNVATGTVTEVTVVK